MKTKIEIKSIFGTQLFEHEAEDNSIKKTLIEAVKGDADLFGADLRGEWGKLEETSDILIIGPIGSRNGYTTVCHTDKGLFVQCGCFRGTIDEFSERVKENHGDNNHARDYQLLIEFAKKKYGV